MTPLVDPPPARPRWSSGAWVSSWSLGVVVSWLSSVVVVVSTPSTSSRRCPSATTRRGGSRSRGCRTPPPASTGRPERGRRHRRSRRPPSRRCRPSTRVIGPELATSAPGRRCVGERDRALVPRRGDAVHLDTGRQAARRVQREGRLCDSGHRDGQDEAQVGRRSTGPHRHATCTSSPSFELGLADDTYASPAAVTETDESVPLELATATPSANRTRIKSPWRYAYLRSIIFMFPPP